MVEAGQWNEGNVVVVEGAAETEREGGFVTITKSGGWNLMSLCCSPHPTL